MSILVPRGKDGAVIATHVLVHFPGGRKVIYTVNDYINLTHDGLENELGAEFLTAAEEAVWRAKLAEKRS